MASMKYGLLLCAAVWAFCVSGSVVIQPEQSAVLCNASHQKAAGLLVKHIKLITGIAPAVNPENTAGKYLFHIGTLPPGKKLTMNFLEENGWIVSEKEAWFYGNTEAAVRHAVCDFLEKALNVRWPTPETTCFLPQKELNILCTNGSFVSNLMRREIRFQGKERLDWADRLRGRNTRKPLTYGHSRTNWWELYGVEHPEYFALYHGVRKPPRDSAWGRKVIATCVSSPAVVEQIIANWNKKDQLLNICENDGWPEFSCSCAACRALDAAPAGEFDKQMGADRYVDFGNRVLSAARKFRPDAKVVYYAYNASTQPPRKTKVAPGTVVGIVPTDFRYAEITKYVTAWKKAGMTEFFYRPNWQHYFLPIGFPLGYDRHAFRILQFMLKNGVVALDYDSPEAVDLFRLRNDYILLHSMAEPERSFEYWEKHYADAFGKASPEILAYFRFWTKIWEDRIEKDLAQLSNDANQHYFYRAFLPQAGKYYKESDFIRSGKLLHAALKKELSPEARKLAEDLKVFHDHAALMLKAYTEKNKANVQAVIAFRQQHNMPELLFCEGVKFCGDLLGVTAPEMQLAPCIKTPLLWHFRLDPQGIGIRDNWFAAGKDLSNWDGMMPTDSVWEKPQIREGHPSAELRKHTQDYDGAAWYSCQVKLPAVFRSRRIMLRFGAVDEAAEIWVNGKKAGSHPFLHADDWRTPFEIEITKLIDWEQAEQRITVMVSDKSGNGGIWKPVYITACENWQLVKAFRNLDFEMPASHGVCPCWSQNAALGMKMKYHAGHPQSGKACGRQISGKSKFDAVSTVVPFAVKAGERYKLTVWNRNTLTAGAALFGIRFADAKNVTLKNGYRFHKVMPGGNEWKRYEMIFEIPASCTNIRIYLKAEQPAGDIFWDTVSLEKSLSAGEKRK